MKLVIFIATLKPIKNKFYLLSNFIIPFELFNPISDGVINPFIIAKGLNHDDDGDENRS